MTAKNHPVDDALIDIAVARREIIHLFLRDGVLCERERRVVQLLDDGHDAVSRDRAIERATDYLTRTREEDVTWYGKRLIADARLSIVHLDDERQRRRVVTLVPEREHEPDDAA